MDYTYENNVSHYYRPQESAYTILQTSESHRAVTSGYLHKLAKGGSPVQHWHRRYYVLYSDGLMYSYKNGRSVKANRTIPVGRLCLRMKFGSDTVESGWPSKAHVNLRFSLIHSNRAYHFYCENTEHFARWQHHLQLILTRFSSSSCEIPETEKSSPAHSPLSPASLAFPPAATPPLPTDKPTCSEGSNCLYNAVGVPVADELDSDSADSPCQTPKLTLVHEKWKNVEEMLESSFKEITSLQF